jgi:hypothetical protein
MILSYPFTPQCTFMVSRLINWAQEQLLLLYVLWLILYVLFIVLTFYCIAFTFYYIVYVLLYCVVIIV